MTKKTAKNPAAFKTNLHNIFATDETLEEDGSWVEVNALLGLEVKVRRMRSDKAAKVYERIVREELGDGKVRKTDEISAEKSKRLLKRQLAEAILVDWKNLRDAETGEEVPFSTDAAFELMAIRDFRDFIIQAASERDAFREKADADAEGNSSSD